MIERGLFADALHEHLSAIRERDIERFARTLHADVHLVGPNGSVIEGYEDAVAAHRGWFAEAGWAFEPSVRWSDERDDAAWALADVRYASGAKLDRFLLFLLFVRDGGRWKLVYDQNTPLMPP
jgi:ketosteroid isomerase-like protein